MSSKAPAPVVAYAGAHGFYAAPPLRKSISSSRRKVVEIKYPHSLKHLQSSRPLARPVLPTRQSPQVLPAPRRASPSVRRLLYRRSPRPHRTPTRKWKIWISRPRGAARRRLCLFAHRPRPRRRYLSCITATPATARAHTAREPPAGAWRTRFAHRRLRCPRVRCPPRQRRSAHCSRPYEAPLAQILCALEL